MVATVSKFLAFSVLVIARGDLRVAGKSAANEAALGQKGFFDFDWLVNHDKKKAKAAEAGLANLEVKTVKSPAAQSPSTTTASTAPAPSTTTESETETETGTTLPLDAAQVMAQAGMVDVDVKQADSLLKIIKVQCPNTADKVRSCSSLNADCYDYSPTVCNGHSEAWIQAQLAILQGQLDHYAASEKILTEKTNEIAQNLDVDETWEYHHADEVMGNTTTTSFSNGTLETTTTTTSKYEIGSCHTLVAMAKEQKQIVLSNINAAKLQEQAEIDSVKAQIQELDLQLSQLNLQLAGNL